MSSSDRTVSKAKLYGIMAGMLLTGTLNTIVLKIMDELRADDGTGVIKTGDEKGMLPKFNHPFFQTAVMFVGEIMVLVAYYATRTCEKKKEISDPMSPGAIAAEQTNLKTSINPLLFAIPAACDFCGSTTMFVSLLMVPASVYQMLRGAIVIITAILAVIFLKKK